MSGERSRLQLQSHQRGYQQPMPQQQYNHSIIFITLSITAFLLFSKFIIIPTILFVCYGILLKMYLPKIIVGLKINNI